MKLPEKFINKLYQDPNLNAHFILKNKDLLTNIKDDDFNQLIMTSDCSTTVNYLKLKLILILESKSDYCNFNIGRILKKHTQNFHSVLMYSLLIQDNLVDNIFGFLNSVKHLQKEDNILYNLQILHTLLEICYICDLDVIKRFDENNCIYMLIINLICNDDKDIRKKLLLDVIPNYINYTKKDEIFPQIWYKIKGSLIETSVIIYLEKYIFSKVESFFILNEIDFWISLQNRITDTTNPLIKKEAMYLLNKSIELSFNTRFKIKLDILKLEDEYKPAWRNFYSLCEISNEKQLHLIEPSFKLMESIKVLHVSWQNCITKLFLRHPHNAVVKYTINKILNSEWSCDIDELVVGLNHVYLYSIENESIMKSLQKYICKLNYTTLNDFLQKFCLIRPSPVPFYFMCNSIKMYNFEKINSKLIQDLLSYSGELPHLYIRKGCQNCIYDIFLKMFDNVTDCADAEDDFIIIVKEFYDIGYLKNFQTDNLKLLIETKFNKFKYKINENLLLKPKHFAVFVAFLTDQRIIGEEWMELNIRKLWLIIKETECINTKFQSIRFLYCIENTICDLNNNNKIRFSNDDIDNFLLQLFKNCLSTNNDNILLIFDVLHLHKINDPDFSEICIDILDTLKNEQKNVLFIVILEKCIKTVNTHNQLYLNTIIPYLNKLMENNKNKLKSVYSKYVRINIEYLLNCDYLNTNVIEIISDYYSIGGNDIILLVIDAITKIIVKKRNDSKNETFDSQLINLLKRLDTDIFNYRANEIFRPAITKYIELIMNTNMPNNDEIKAFARTFCLKIFGPDQTISGLRNKILEHSTTELNLQILVEALVFCPILRKDQKIEFDTCNLISKNIAEIFEENYYELDIRVTSLAVSILQHGIAKHEINSNEILLLLQEKYNINAGKRYYGDSQIHITKLRILQALHLYVDHLNKTDNEQLNKWMYNCLVNESQQPSIKILIQWLLIRTYEKLDNIPNIITNLIKNSEHLTGTSITSIFPILYHLLKRKHVSDDKIFSQCFKFLLPFTMRPQFNIRYMAQLSLKNIYEIIENDETKSRNSIIYEAALDVINQTVTDKNVDSILTFEHLPYTIETIYYEIPRLTNVSHTKWIPVEYFNDLPLIELISESTLKHLQPKSIPKDVQSFSNEENINMNVQKKIDTVSLNTFLEDTNTQIKNGNLKVVASLIDRAPNLGGLSRTCEIFGVKQYVLNNIQFMKNKEYQSLSMSSEKWVDTIEVKLEHLADYLIEMKGQGYKVVGAEQTADSKTLDTFCFEKNTVLLLGNEKEGIPANLICLLDDCIEIPQFGQIRSLNVHVAAALFIWEYAKQFA